MAISSLLYAMQINVAGGLPTKTTADAPTVIDISQGGGKQVWQLSADQNAIFIATGKTPLERLQVVGGHDVTVLGGTFKPTGAKTAAAVYLEKFTGDVTIKGVVIDNAQAGERDGIAVSAPAGTRPNVTIDHSIVENISGSRNGVHGDIFQSYGSIGKLSISNFYGSSNYQGFFLGGTADQVPLETNIQNTTLRYAPGGEKNTYLLWFDEKSATGTHVSLSNVSIGERDGEHAESTAMMVVTDGARSAVGRIGDSLSAAAASIVGSVQVDSGGVTKAQAGAFDLSAELAKALHVDHAVMGTAGVDQITQYGGHNAVFGGAGNDILTTGSGNDILDGGLGADFMQGGKGNDVYVVDNIWDKVGEWMTGGTDTVLSTVNYTLGNFLENLTLKGTADLAGTGNQQDNVVSGNSGANLLLGMSGDDRLFGDAGVDTLHGGWGKDYLDGGAGADQMMGGDGNDVYLVDDQNDQVIEWSKFSIGGEDLVLSTVSYGLSANVEHLQLIGDDLINGTGNSLANEILGNSAANLLRGAVGNDTLDGGAGVDTLEGGAGSDTFVLHQGEINGDVVLDFNGNGKGVGDTLVFEGFGAGAHVVFDQNVCTVYSDAGTETFTINFSGTIASADYIFA